MMGLIGLRASSRSREPSSADAAYSLHLVLQASFGASPAQQTRTTACACPASSVKLPRSHMRETDDNEKQEERRPTRASASPAQQTSPDARAQLSRPPASASPAQQIWTLGKGGGVRHHNTISLWARGDVRVTSSTTSPRIGTTDSTSTRELEFQRPTGQGHSPPRAPS